MKQHFPTDLVKKKKKKKSRIALSANKQAWGPADLFHRAHDVVG